MKKKSLVCLVTAVLMACAMIPSTAFAVENVSPAPPVNISIYTGNGKNIITWPAVADAGGYMVYRKCQYENWKQIDRTTRSRTIDNSRELIPGIVYYYKIHTYIRSGTTMQDIESGDSAVVSVKYILPASKITKLSKKSRTSIKVYWSRVSDATGYKIYQKTGKGKWKCVKTIKSNNTLSYTKKSLKKGKKYYYKIRAYKTYGGHTGYAAYSSSKSKKL